LYRWDMNPPERSITPWPVLGLLSGGVTRRAGGPRADVKGG
jgi:hypothetical protein